MSKGTVNKVILIGRLGGDPEVRYAPSGSAVANFSLATNRSFKDRDGNQQEETDWHRITAWTRLAEFAKQYLKKGMRIYVEGRVHYREWQDQNGVKRTSTDIIANDIQMLESFATRTGDTLPENVNESDLQIPDNIDQAPDDTVPF